MCIHYCAKKTLRVPFFGVFRSRPLFRRFEQNLQVGKDRFCVRFFEGHLVYRPLHNSTFYGRLNSPFYRRLSSPIFKLWQLNTTQEESLSKKTLQSERVFVRTFYSAPQMVLISVNRFVIAPTSLYLLPKLKKYVFICC